MHGGVKFYRGAAKAARTYVERDCARYDDCYLAEGDGIAMRFVAEAKSSDVEREVHIEGKHDMDGETYEDWVAGMVVETRQPKGRLRKDASGLRFVEVTINGPKTWSLAAALNPEVSAALDAAQGRAAQQIITYLTAHATTRVGPRGRQVQIPVEQIEAAVIRHYTSRAGDPHRHLHLQINARVFAKGAWRGPHSVGVRDMIEALNGIGHAAVARRGAGIATASSLGSAGVGGSTAGQGRAEDRRRYRRAVERGAAGARLRGSGSIGHSEPTTTLNTYAHLWPTAEDRTRKAAQSLIDGALTGVLADSVRTERGQTPSDLRKRADHTLKRNSTTSPSAMT